jgi:hypothetical protein
VAASAKYHKRKQYKIGAVKTAVAKTPGTDDVVYEVVYIELLDPYLPTKGKTKKSYTINTKNTITVDGIQYSTTDDNSGLEAQDPARRRPSNPNTIKVDSDAILISQSKDYVKYISNIENMRDSLKQVGETERNFLPLWMRTAQEDSIQELGYVLAIPLCYTKQGKSKIIANAIKNQNFDFSKFAIDIDRYTIDSTTGNSDEQYIVFANYQFNT